MLRPLELNSPMLYYRMAGDETEYACGSLPKDWKSAKDLGLLQNIFVGKGPLRLLKCHSAMSFMRQGFPIELLYSIKITNSCYT
jgi:hypothetical protein